jgi:hypothetical protein
LLISTRLSGYRLATASKQIASDSSSLNIILSLD